MLTMTKSEKTSCSTSVEFITPIRAQEYLDRRGAQRPVVAARVRLYAGMMSRGKWLLNGEGIHFDINGALLNGQHRLLACVMSGAGFSSLVVRGLPPEVMTSFDTGRGRKAMDVIGILGGKNTSVVAAGVVWILRYRSRDASLSKFSFPHSDIIEFWESNQISLDHSADVSRIARSILQPGISVGFHFLFSELDFAMADSFMDQLGTGAELSKDDPLYLLREVLIKNKSAKTKFASIEIAARVVRAWNARRQGTPLRLLRGTFDVGSGSKFPTIV